MLLANFILTFLPLKWWHSIESYYIISHLDGTYLWIEDLLLWWEINALSLLQGVNFLRTSSTRKLEVGSLQSSMKAYNKYSTMIEKFITRQLFVIWIVSVGQVVVTWLHMTSKSLKIFNNTCIFSHSHIYSDLCSWKPHVQF